MRGLTDNDPGRRGVEEPRTPTLAGPLVPRSRMSAVDNVDSVAGHGATVFALAGASALRHRTARGGLLPGAV